MLLFRRPPKASLKLMKILLLGATVMLGQAIVSAAMRRGQSVTCLARGSSPAPEGASFIAADRDDLDALSPVSSETWDAVVDLSHQPVRVRRAVSELVTAHWVFVSTTNFYAFVSSMVQGESADIRSALTAATMEDLSTYGEAKVACEEAI